MDKAMDFIKQHPIVVTAIVVAVFVWFLFSGSSTQATDNGAAATASIANSVAASQQAAAVMQANVNDNAAKIALATIAGKVQEAYIASSLQATAINANLEQQANVMSVLQTVADTTFGQASAGLAQNYNTQLWAAGGATASLPETIYGAPKGVTVNGVYYPHGATIPAGNNDPSGVNEINTANTNLEEMYNNLLKAVTGGTNFSQNAIITTGGQGGNGTLVDPIFVNTADPSKLPTVTDVTPGQNNAYGWLGSFVDPNTGVNIKIG